MSSKGAETGRPTFAEVVRAAADCRTKQKAYSVLIKRQEFGPKKKLAMYDMMNAEAALDKLLLRCGDPQAGLFEEAEAAAPRARPEPQWCEE